MKNLLLPITMPVVLLLLLVLVLTANLSRLLSWIASTAAMISVNITLWHGSVMLLRLLTSTQNTTATQGNTNESDRQTTQKYND